MSGQISIYRFSFVIVSILVIFAGCKPRQSDSQTQSDKTDAKKTVFFQLPGKYTYEEATQKFDGVVVPNKKLGCDAYDARLIKKAEYWATHNSHTGGPYHWSLEKIVITPSGMKTPSRGSHIALCVKFPPKEIKAVEITIKKPDVPFTLGHRLTWNDATVNNQLISPEGNLRVVMPTCYSFNSRLPQQSDIDAGIIKMPIWGPGLLLQNGLVVFERSRGGPHRAKEHRPYSIKCIPIKPLNKDP